MEWNRRVSGEGMQKERSMEDKGRGEKGICYRDGAAAPSLTTYLSLQHLYLWLFICSVGG